MSEVSFTLDLESLQEKWPYIPWEQHKVSVTGMTSEGHLISLQGWTESAFWFPEGVSGKLIVGDYQIVVDRQKDAVAAVSALFAEARKRADAWASINEEWYLPSSET